MSEETKKFGQCLYTKLENGTTTVYVKLKYYQGEFNTKLFENDNEVNPLKYLNTRCNVRAAISIESILIGNSITLQLRLCEADVKHIKKEYKRLLPSTETSKQEDWLEHGESIFDGFNANRNITFN